MDIPNSDLHIEMMPVELTNPEMKQGVEDFKHYLQEQLSIITKEFLSVDFELIASNDKGRLNSGPLKSKYNIIQIVVLEPISEDFMAIFTPLKPSFKDCLIWIADNLQLITTLWRDRTSIQKEAKLLDEDYKNKMN